MSVTVVVLEDFIRAVLGEMYIKLSLYIDHEFPNLYEKTDSYCGEKAMALKFLYSN